ncbi:MAG: hypothetical protein FJZ76_05985 [Bacteroidetes bacterium]|nr:hypothetical protein [Bacteroidota bacterium]
MENSENPQIVKTSEWLITYLIASIPLVGIVMLFVWAFGSSTNPSKSNWAKASLIWIAIITVIYFIFGAALVASMM